MIKLQVLGRLELFDADGRVMHSVLAQPKRQAVLAWLAVAVPRGFHRRDSLLALLWPDSDDEHARGSLSKAVSHLRQSLGADLLLSRGHAELGLDWHLIWCDAVGFEEALDRGALAEAMAIYGGELLPGFHVDEAPEFDQWLERERARLRARAVQAVQMLSEREEAASNLAAAIEWARRGTTLDTFDEALVRRVMTLLDRAGDRAGALRTYDEFAAHLETELETEPAAETCTLMETIRDRPVVRLQPASIPTPMAAPSIDAPVVAPRAPASRRWVTAAATAAGLIAMSAWALLGRNPADAANRPAATVAVIPFAVEGDPAVANLGEGMVSLLADAFNKEGQLHAIDAKAIRRSVSAVEPTVAGADSVRALVARFKPRFLMVGQVVARGDSLTVSAALYDSVAGREPVSRAEVFGRGGDLAHLSGELAWQILATHPMYSRPRGRPRPSEVTSSLVALRSFLAGEEELTQGRFTEAVQAYRSAVDADSTFAIAYLNLGRAANWAGDYPMADYAIGRALKFIDRLNPIDQLCVRARQAYQLGEPQEAERLLKLALINDVGVAEAWFDLGEIHFHWGGILGHSQAEARNAYEQALAIYGNDVGSLVHLTRIAAAEGRVDRVDSLARKATSRHLDEPQALELRGLRAFAKGDRAEIDRVQAAINRLDETAAYSVSTMLAVFAAEFPAVGGVPAGLRGDRRSARYQVIGTLLSAELAMAHGHSADASRILAPSSHFGAARSIEYRAALASLPFRTIKPSEALALRKELMELHEGALIGAGPEHYASPSIYPARRAYLLGMLSLKGADTAAALQEADQLERGVENEYDRKYRVEVARLIRSEIARSRGDAARALELLGHPSVLPGKVLPGVLHYPSAHERFLRAELARSLGRTDEALRWYGTFPDPSAYDLMYLPAVHAGAGSAYEQRRDVANARASYERALALFAEGDAEWAPFVNAIRARLAAVR